MTLDVETIQRRRKVMMIANVVAALVAVIGIMLYAQGQTWAIAMVIAAVVGGFAVQLWFMAALRGRKGDS
ncbi:MAG: hypothetical protein JNL41_03310 [Phenylobacterium sp.]|uniref:hypothetical protein n=1 Tax=Phenylobacterium sp. TaxID=1871053 RepID=UPI001A550E29|nr:hypothetical protein [Phenylobacterium sp.]MBL8553282.1 hypothetical protein [Phenylobacterium sp.]